MTIAPTTRPPDSVRAARTSGAVLGLVVFLVGIALLGYVFVSAETLFNAPPPTIPAAPAPVTPTPETAADAVAASAAAMPSAGAVVGQALIGFGQKLLVLLLMCIAGSVIASRGIELFFKTLAAAHAAPSAAPPPAHD